MDHRERFETRQLGRHGVSECGAIGAPADDSRSRRFAILVSVRSYRDPEELDPRKGTENRTLFEAPAAYRFYPKPRPPSESPTLCTMLTNAESFAKCCRMRLSCIVEGRESRQRRVVAIGTFRRFESSGAQSIAHRNVSGVFAFERGAGNLINSLPTPTLKCD